MSFAFASLVFLSYSVYVVGLFMVVLYTNGPARLKPVLRKRVRFLSLVLWSGCFPPLIFILVGSVQESFEQKLIWGIVGYLGLALYFLVAVVVPSFIGSKPPSEPQDGGAK